MHEKIKKIDSNTLNVEREMNKIVGGIVFFMFKYFYSNGNYLPNSNSAFRPVDPPPSSIDSNNTSNGSLTHVVQIVTRQMHRYELSFDVW